MRKAWESDRHKALAAGRGRAPPAGLTPGGGLRLLSNGADQRGDRGDELSGGSKQGREVLNHFALTPKLPGGKFLTTTPRPVIGGPPPSCGQTHEVELF